MFTGLKLASALSRNVLDSQPSIFSKYGIFSGPYFSTFGLNTEIYGVYGKIRTRKNAAFGHF